MFQVGDRVVYGTLGICRVAEVAAGIVIWQKGGAL